MLRSVHPVLFITSNLGGGGAERALVDIVNQLDRSQFKPHLGLFQREGPFLDQLASDVIVHEIQSSDHGFIHRNLTRFRGIRTIVSEIQPSLIMSMLWQVNAVVLLTNMIWDLGVPIIINEQSVPKASLVSDRRRRLLWPLIKWVYRQADMTIAISSGIAAELKEEIQLGQHKIKVIHNPIKIPTDQELRSKKIDFKMSSKPIIMAAGRLTPLKNYPMLLRGISLVLEKQDVELYILGQGPERDRIDSLADSLGIAKNVHMLGFVPDPGSYISQADIFTLTSNHEGFGNVIIEALALGIPVIATDCPYGPREILENGRYGRLVPVDNEMKLAEAILQLLHHSEERDILAEAGRRRSYDFSVVNIVQQYEQVFTDMIESSKFNAS